MVEWKSNYTKSMKTIAALFLAFIYCLGLSSCGENDDCENLSSTASTIEILTLGDSRVEGATPEFESYRYELWKNLVNNNWDFDLMGSRIDAGSYEKLNGLCFDNEHEGTGGATTSDNLDILQSVTFSQVPEVALVGIGGNDLTGGVPVETVATNLGLIIDELRSLNPNIIIFVEQIAPGLSSFMTPGLTTSFNDYNTEVMALATSKNTTDSPVISIDMAAGWSDDYMADDVHYNSSGAKIVADRYYAAMDLAIEQ
mgnify:CR=1 FL=1